MPNAFDQADQPSELVSLARRHRLAGEIMLQWSCLVIAVVASRDFFLAPLEVTRRLEICWRSSEPRVFEFLPTNLRCIDASFFGSCFYLAGFELYCCRKHLSAPIPSNFGRPLGGIHAEFKDQMHVVALDIGIDIFSSSVSIVGFD